MPTLSYPCADAFSRELPGIQGNIEKMELSAKSKNFPHYRLIFGRTQYCFDRNVIASPQTLFERMHNEISSCNIELAELISRYILKAGVASPLCHQENHIVRIQ